jgi:TonB family protein
MRVLAVGLLVSGSLFGQVAVQSPAPAGAVVDKGLVAAQAWVGRALILRGFYAGGELDFDAAGRVKGTPKTTDWTLAGMELEKVSRRASGEFLLEGTRVVIGYNQGAHTFDRHPLKDEKLRVVLPAADGRAVDAEILAVFSQGIDPALQRSMPGYWSHYFVPSLEWPADELKGVPILGLNAKVPADLVMPVPEKKLEPEYTAEARGARVKGTVQATMVVDPEGVPRRVTIRQPLGYGLDARVAETLARYRFHPGTLAGKPVAVEIVFNQGFDFVAVPALR